MAFPRDLAAVGVADRLHLGLPLFGVAHRFPAGRRPPRTGSRRFRTCWPMWRPDRRLNQFASAPARGPTRSRRPEGRRLEQALPRSVSQQILRLLACNPTWAGGRTPRDRARSCDSFSIRATCTKGAVRILAGRGVHKGMHACGGRDVGSQQASGWLVFVAASRCYCSQ